jgi:hypothetical protein
MRIAAEGAPVAIDVRIAAASRSRSIGRSTPGEANALSMRDSRSACQAAGAAAGAPIRPASTAAFDAGSALIGRV